MIKLTLAYEGTSFYGMQKTREGPSIEETLEKAIEQLLRLPVLLEAASRTDRGVHAKGQIVAFAADIVNLPSFERSLRAILPPTIALIRAERAPSDFHPTLHARRKEYQYQICNGPFQSPFHRSYSWHYRYPLDLETMRAAAKLLIGTHDYSAFSNQRFALGEAIRTVLSIEIESLPSSRFLFKIRGENFLYKMVRTLVGTLAYVGSGRLPLESLSSLFQNRDRSLAGMTAPAHGLCLQKVWYDPPN